MITTEMELTSVISYRDKKMQRQRREEEMIEEKEGKCGLLCAKKF